MESQFGELDLVIKVKYGDSLKRINAYVSGRALDHTMANLKSKIITCFNLSPAADIILTYTDEDGDIVMLDDDEDLHDAAITQQLNPLRITVQLKSAAPAPDSNVTTPELSQIHSSIEEAMKSLPESLHSTLSKISQDLFVTATPALAELLDKLTKLGLSNTARPTDPAQASSAELKLKTESKKPETENAAKTKTGPAFNSSPSVDKGKSVMFTASPSTPEQMFCPFVEDLPVNTTPTNNKNNNGNNNENSNGNNNGNKNGNNNVFLTDIPPYPAGWNNMGCLADIPPYPARWNNNGFSADIPPYPSRLFPFGHPYRKSDGGNESMMHAIHRGVQCDGCGAQPIVGPRYKSNMKMDYDLCGACFSRMGNEAEYTKIDRPIFPPHRMSRDLALFRDFATSLNKPHPRFAPPVHGCGMRPKRTKLESRFIQDVTVPDGAVIAPSTPFTKIWRMRNNGSNPWPFGTQLVWVGGDQFASQNSVQLEVPVNGFPVDVEIDVAVDFNAPSRAGRYVSYWRLASPLGQKFGQRVWVLIHVEQPNSTDYGVIKPALNLNLPPETNNISAGPQIIIDVNSNPIDDTFPGPIANNSNNPIGEGLVVSPRTPEPVIYHVPEPVVVPTAVSYPLIDFTTPPASSSIPPPAPASALLAGSGNNDGNAPPLEEETVLLRELEQMGFKQVDLNKEVLRLNKYNLEQSVEDLCGFAEWDPLLEELQGMGFQDKEMNKKMLAKNGGSIKRAVMDLIAGEKKAE